MSNTIDTTKNYELLASAIVKNAIRDYERGMNLMNRRNIGCSGYIEGQKLVDDVRRFFHSDWSTTLVKSDSLSVFKQIEENYKKYGKCMPFQKKDDEEIVE